MAPVMELRVLTWNLFHGRDFPPDPALRNRRRLSRKTERNSTHVQVNRDLTSQFTQVLCSAQWDVALLQECPPRWSAQLAAACRAVAQRSLTSRNWIRPLQAFAARRNPDLLGSWEGGSNLTLARGETNDAKLLNRRELVLRRRPERRTMAYAELGCGICVVNLHASTIPALAEEEIRHAAATAVEWARNRPLIVGGDFNVRPERTRLFEELAERFELRAPTAEDSIDHLLARRLAIADPPSAWAPEERELPYEGLRLRLSDHAPVAATFRIGDSDRDSPDSLGRPPDGPA
jgi:endonuclease/exonuclease/phosphatase family metal-dependent hydrolase